MSPAKWLLLVSGSVALLSSSADAQTCMGDDTCPRGFRCEVSRVEACDTAPVPPPGGSMCPKDQPCAQPLPLPPAATCEAREYYSCVPVNCESDADCANGMVCHAQEQVSCTAPAEPACEGGLCPPRKAPPGMCTSEIVRSCVPRHLLPCTQASDCGPGFRCEPHEICGCSTPAVNPVPPTPVPLPAADAGIGAAPAANPAPADPAAPIPPGVTPPTCECQKTPEKYCTANEIVCRRDSDCPALWTCHATVMPTRPTCDRPAGADGGVCAPQEMPAAEYRCVPPYEDLNIGVTTDVRGTTTATPGNAAPDMTTAPPVVAPAPGPGAPQTESGASENTPGGDGVVTPQHVRACTVANPGTSGGLGFWVGFLTLAAAGIYVARRKR